MQRLLLILLFLPCFSFGQGYVALPDSNTEWTSHNANGWQGEFQWYTYWSITSADTIANSETYNLTNGIYRGYRNDTAARKVYGYHAGDNAEYLLYDFTLQVGDTFFLPPYHDDFCTNSTFGVVLSIDSLLVGNNYNRRINFNYNGEGTPSPHVEGVGSMGGLYQYHGSCFEYGGGIVCFKVNDTAMYEIGQNCSYPFSIREMENSATTFLYPNPTSGEARITNLEGRTTNVEVFDLFGRSVPFDFDIQNSLLDIRHCSPGLYFVKVGEAVRKLILH